MPRDLAAMSAEVSRNVQRFRGGLVVQAHRLCVSLNSRLERNKEEEDEQSWPAARQELIQGYLAYDKKPPPPRTLQQAFT